MADGYQPPEGYLTMEGAAERLGVSLVTMRKAVREREHRNVPGQPEQARAACEAGRRRETTPAGPGGKSGGLS